MLLFRKTCHKRCKIQEVLLYHAQLGIMSLEALCDSGASINLMPLLVVKRLSLGKLTPTTSLQMVDRSMAQPEGILEYMLVKVGKFIFPWTLWSLTLRKTSRFHYCLVDHS